jgi:hypothetical protein
MNPTVGSELDSWRRFIRLGWSNLIVGILSPIGLAVAMLNEGLLWQGGWIFAVMDCVPASIAAASAYGLLRKEGWGLKATCLASTAVLLPAVASLVRLGNATLFAAHVQRFTRDPQLPHLISVVGARALFNAFQVVYWLFAIGFVFRRHHRIGVVSDVKSTSNKALVTFSGLGVLTGAIVLACEVGLLLAAADRR